MRSWRVLMTEYRASSGDRFRPPRDWVVDCAAVRMSGHKRTLLEVLHVAAGERDADAVHLDGGILLELLRLHRRHVRLRARASPQQATSEAHSKGHSGRRV